MRVFDYSRNGSLRNNEVCNLISSIHEFRGKQTLFISAKQAGCAEDVIGNCQDSIDSRQYDATFRADGLADIEKIGLAYCKNRVERCR